MGSSTWQSQSQHLQQRYYTGRGNGGDCVGEGISEEAEEQAAFLMNEVGELRSLLLRILGRLAESDGAEGVQAGTGLEGRTWASAARECPDWYQALAAHGCLELRSQALALGGIDVGGGGGGGSGGAGSGPNADSPSSLFFFLLLYVGRP
jgi:hypothetical protein